MGWRRTEERSASGGGFTRRWYLDDALVREMTYGAHGFPVGPAREWYVTGELRRLRAFNDRSRIEGEDISYWPEGTIRWRRRRVAQQAEGHEERNYRDGSPRLVGDWKGGLREGMWRWSYPDGSTQLEVPYLADHVDGNVRLWEPDGTLAFELRAQRGVTLARSVITHFGEAALRVRGYDPKDSFGIDIYDRAGRPLVRLATTVDPGDGIGRFTATKRR